ncbi:hypothetical protein OA92_21355 [Marinomonas sp. SBI22]|uniref:hypothetical protein n=1 Tax=unclassified Marinomonas TaxID=196814 RepID=UPI0007AF3452|nr:MULTISPECIES: hypothetical protein [unclassified Marinomonas]KZM39142.1 hypothetical protein OA92_21355 [Marinomonas sp. SBI22]KZM39926.1 hypothetical protein OA91_21210 [Marinomonas sp. SBI8L]
MKKLLVFAAVVCFSTTVTAEQNIQLAVKFDDMKMCLHSGVVFSIGGRIIVNGSEYECVNARKNSYYIDESFSARWIPATISTKQQKP